MQKIKYTYEQQNNQIRVTNTDNSIQYLNITAHIFLDKKGKEIRKQLKSQFPLEAKKFVPILADAVGSKRLSEDYYDYIRAIQLATFINTRWYRLNDGPDFK